MTRRILLRLLLLGTACALALAALTLGVLRALSESSSADLRKATILFLARMVEGGPYAESVAHIESLRQGDQVLPMELWVVSEQGEVLASNTEAPLPEPWEHFPRPEGIHEVQGLYGPLGVLPEASVARLDTSPAHFLVLRVERSRLPLPMQVLRLALPLLAIVTSGFLALLLTLLYLRRKSREARKVLARMEQGDLKARFSVGPFDEVGSLTLDFNRMATELERLVARVEQTERVRSTLLQELSHDLRTPLTSLRACVDTLLGHAEELSETHRRELLGVLHTELSYFSTLLEQLFFIAQMGEPHYKRTTELFDVGEVLSTELQAIRALGTRELSWHLELPPPVESLVMSGDPHLVRRLFRNALDNATRFARGHVTVSASAVGESLCVRVRDDGPGMSAEQLARFGRSRSQRMVVAEGSALRVSLGLGSVIMRTILELHRGSWKVESPPAEGSSSSGVCLRLVLPRARTATTEAVEQGEQAARDMTPHRERHRVKS